jgi:hypothetical protein
MTKATLITGAAFLAVCAFPASVQGAPAIVTFPPGGIIQSALISNSTPCAGRPFLVHVVAQHPVNSAVPVEVYIDGAPGRPQMLQFFAAAPQRKISIFAITPERIEDRQEITVAVQNCPLVTTTLELLHSRNPYHRDRVDFHAVLRSGRARAYQWSFGDGTTAVTQTPFVSHDYAPELTPSAKFSYFNVTVTETASNLSSARRIAVGSSFALSRSMGFVQAEVKTGVMKLPQGFVVSVDIANHHKSSITLNRYIKQYLPCDNREATRTQIVAAESALGSSNAIVHPPGVKSPGRVTVAKNTSVRTRLVLPLEDIPPETCGLGFNLIGTSSDRKPVYGSFYVKVRQNPLFTVKVSDPTTLLALEHLGDNQLVDDLDMIPADELHELTQRGFIERTRDGWRRK